MRRSFAGNKKPPVFRRLKWWTLLECNVPRRTIALGKCGAKLFFKLLHGLTGNIRSQRGKFHALLA